MSENDPALSGELDTTAPEAAVIDENAGTPADDAANPEAEPKPAEQDDNSGDEAGEAKAEDGSSPEPDKEQADKNADEAKRKRKQTAQERINEVTRRAREAERRAEAAEARVAKLMEGHSPPNPNDEQYLNDPDAYQADLTAHRMRALRQEDVSEDAQTARQDAAAARAEAFQARAESFRDEVPDFDQVAFGNHTTITESMAELIAESDMGPQIAYFMGKNPAEARGIASMGKTQQAIAIGRLEGRLESQGKAPRKVTQAPAPIVPAAGKKAPTKLKYDPGMSMDDYQKWRKQEGIG